MRRWFAIIGFVSFRRGRWWLHGALPSSRYRRRAFVVLPARQMCAHPIGEEFLFHEARILFKSPPFTHRCVLAARIPEQSRVYKAKTLAKLMAQRWQSEGPHVANQWGNDGKPMANRWQIDGKPMANRWQIDGKSMAKRWPIGGGTPTATAMANRWQTTCEAMANTWQMDVNMANR